MNSYPRFLQHPDISRAESEGPFYNYIDESLDYQFFKEMYTLRRCLHEDIKT